jgi:lysophospholipase L1-like esterase
LEIVLRIARYIFAAVITIIGMAVLLELGLQRWLPDNYLGYLIEREDGVTWGYGPFEPARPATGFNTPISLKKPADTIRIVSLGASETEGWLTAKVVFNKYGQPWGDKEISSYSRALEFSMNEIAGQGSKKIEVINLGVAAYNITDVIRMLKDSMKLDPDLFIIQIGGNETWTGKRHSWSSYLDNDIPYLYSELAFEILAETQANWGTLSKASNGFNPMALFSTAARPIVNEPPGRALGMEERLKTYRRELNQLGEYLNAKDIPTLFLVPTQNLSGYEPFGSMVAPGTSDGDLEMLNELLIDALKERNADAKEKLVEILSIDEGIAEANYQLGLIYLAENNPEKARQHFWRANDRDLVLKRLPSAFHGVSRQFIAANNFAAVDVMGLYEANSDDGVVGYNWLDDDVHPHRRAQFFLANELVTQIVAAGMLPVEGYSGDLQALPGVDDYNRWTGFDLEAEGSIAYLKAAHNHLTFGRYRQRLRWDPRPDVLLEPIINNLNIANQYAPSDKPLFMSAVLNLYLGQLDDADALVAQLDCGSSAERGAYVNQKVWLTGRTAIGKMKTGMREDMTAVLTKYGCVQ